MYWLTLSLLSIPFGLNASFLILLVLYVISYTNPFLIPLREAGTRSFNIINATLIVYAVTTGCLNCYLLRSWLKGSGVFKPRRYEQERIERHMIRYGLKPKSRVMAMPRAGRSFATSGGVSHCNYDEEDAEKSKLRKAIRVMSFLAVGLLPLILALVLPNEVSKKVWANGCNNWDLMAEITTPYPTTLQSFDREKNPVEGEIWNVTTRVEFYERGEWVYGMDLFRRLDEPLGFPVDERKIKSRKVGPPNDRVLVFSARNTSAPYDHEVDPLSYVFMGIQIFPSHPYLPPVLNRTALLWQINYRSIPSPTVVSRRYPLFGSPNEPLVNSAPIGRVIYTLGPQSSHYSILTANSSIPGIQPPEQIGTILTHKNNLVFSGTPLSLQAPENEHRWRYIHSDILYGRRTAEACLPPNPKLVVPGLIDLAVGGTVVKGPAFSTPWLPSGLKGVKDSERCRSLKVCGGGKREKGRSIAGKKPASHGGEYDWDRTYVTRTLKGVIKLYKRWVI